MLDNFYSPPIPKHLVLLSVTAIPYIPFGYSLKSCTFGWGKTSNFCINSTHGCELPSFLALAINVHDLPDFISRKCSPPNPRIVPETTTQIILCTVVRQLFFPSSLGSSCWMFFSLFLYKSGFIFLSLSVYHIRFFLV